MIYFLHGPDTYRSRKRLGEIIAEFGKKTDAVFSVTRVDAEERSDPVLGIGRTASLFSQKELVVIERISQAGDKERSYAAGQLDLWQKSKDLTVIFWEAVFDGDDTLKKSIIKASAKAQEFKLLAGPSLSRWADAEAQARGVRLASQEKQLLLARTGPDLWAIANELEKIRAGWSLDRARAEGEQVWNLTDAFLRRERRSFIPLERLLRSGQEPIYLLAALSGSLRTLCLVWWGEKTGKQKIATKSLHPFVAKKNSELANYFDGRDLRRAYSALVSTDLGLKTGRLPSPLPLIQLVLQKESSA